MDRELAHRYGIQIASDLHIEFYSHMPIEEQMKIWSELLVNDEGIGTLALLGDIGMVYKPA